MADERLICKVPHDDLPLRLTALAREQAVLRYLWEVDLSPYHTPRLIEASANPAYTVATYVPGHTYTRHETMRMSSAERVKIGRSIGQYLTHQIAAMDPVVIAQRLPKERDIAWPAVFKQYIGNFAHPRYPELSALTAEAYARWEAYLATESSHTLYAVHGDLSPHNLTFNDTHEVIGVIDLARMKAGTLASEVSVLPNYGVEVFAGCLAELASCGLDIDPAGPYMWRDMKQLQVLPYWIQNGGLHNPAYLQARKTVAQRYPKYDLAELY